MMKFFRKHRNTLMIVIAILAIPFIFYFNKSDFSARGAGDFGKFYDRKISVVEAQRTARLLALANRLGLNDFTQALTPGARDDNERAVEFIFNLLILRREAERLGIDATSAERADFVRNLRIFQGPSGGFDVGRYTEFTQEFLAPNGFTDAQVEELARDDIALRRIKELVSVGVAVADAESRENYERAYGKMTASVIHLRTADFAKDIKPSDDDIKKYYDAHQGELKTEEKRKIQFVAFTLSDEQKKLTGKDRVDGLQKLQTRASDFAQALSEKNANFEQAAARFQRPVQTTDEFTSAKPDPKLGANAPQLGPVAFQLNPEESNSDLIEVPDGYYVLHLAGVTPSRALTIDEARPKIVESLTNNRSRQAMSTKAAQVVHDLRESLKAGEPLAAAAEKLKLKPDKLPPFTLMEDDTAPEDPAKPKDKNVDLFMVRNAAASLQPGEVSEFFPSPDGGMIAVLEKREPPDDMKFGTKKKEVVDKLSSNKREIAFYEWLREKQREAGILSSQTAKG